MISIGKKYSKSGGSNKNAAKYLIQNQKKYQLIINVISGSSFQSPRK